MTGRYTQPQQHQLQLVESKSDMVQVVQQNQ